MRESNAVQAQRDRYHILKTDPEVFQAVLSGAKTFEIRLNDRGYAVGDVLGLRETKHTGAEMRAGAPLVYTGRECQRFVSHVLTGYGLADGWCCLSFRLPHAGDASAPVADASSDLPGMWDQSDLTGGETDRIPASATVTDDKCLTCSGHGMVGGLTPHSGYDAKPCPDCAPVADEPNAEAWLIEWQPGDGNTWVEADANEVRAREKAQRVGGTATPMIRAALASAPVAGEAQPVAVTDHQGDVHWGHGRKAGIALYAAPQASTPVGDERAAQEYGSPADVAQRIEQYLAQDGRMNSGTQLLYEAMKTLRGLAGESK